MNKIKRFSLAECLVLLGIGILVLGAWDMQLAAAAQPEAWYQGTNAPTPIAFYGFTQCVDEPDVFYVLGSYPSESYFYSYDASSNTWEILSDFPIIIERSAVVCYGGEIYAAGGNSGPAAIDTLYIYDITANTWTQESNLPHPLKQAAVGVWSGRIYLVGGTDINLPWTPLNHVDTYDIATDTWIDQAETPIPFAASSAGYVQVGRYLYVVGGWSGDFNHNVNQTQRFDMATNTWETGPEFTSDRAAFDLVATESHLYASGGDADGGNQANPTDLVEALDLSTWPDGEWVDIADPLPLPLEGNGGFCSESVSGGEIWSIGGTDGLNLLGNTYYRPTEPCVHFGVDLPALWIAEEKAEAGTMVEYWLTITNTGVITDYFTLEVSTTWEASLPLGGPGPIGPGDSIPIAIDVEIPTDALPGDEGTIEIRAISISNPSAFDDTAITITVGLRDFAVQPILPDSQEGHPGKVLTYTLLVSNTGDFKDSYNVEISATWETTASLSIGPLLPGEDFELVVVVTIPLDAEAGDWDYALITLNSQVKPLINHSTNLTSTAVWYRMLMPLALKN